MAGESAYPFNCTFDVPDRCPYCRKEWWDKDVSLTNVVAHARNLAQAVHYFMDPNYAAEVAGLKFGIRLEIDGEQSPEGAPTP